MPTNELQLGRVVASELSPYLVGLGAVTAALSILWLRRARASAGKVTVLALVEALLAVGIAGLPVSQQPLTVARADDALREAVGGTVARSTAARAGLINVTRDIPFRIVGAATLRLDRYDPPFPGPHAGVIVVHDGAWSAGDKGDVAAPSNRYLAARGYVVYDIQYRLAPAYRVPSALADVDCTAADGASPHAGHG